MIQCTRIHHRLGGVVATEHYEQVADHGSLLVVVQLDYFLLAQLLQSHLHHRDSAFHNLLSG